MDRAPAYPFDVIRERMRKHPGPVLDFAFGRHLRTPPEWLPEFVREHAALAMRRHLAEERESSVAALREVLDRVYGLRVSNAAILPAPSGRAAIAGLVATEVAPDDAVLVTEPGYPAFARVAAARPARIVAVPLLPERGFDPDLDAIEGGAPRFAGLNYPNNPTGVVPPPQMLAALRARLAPGALLFNDAIYGPWVHEGRAYSTLASSEQRANTVELHGTGKLFALGPLGVAFLVGDEDPIDRVRRHGGFAWTQVTSLQMRVAARCLADWSHVERSRDRLRERIEKLRETLAGLGFDPYPVAAGMYVLCPAPPNIGGKTVGSAAEAAERLLTNFGVAVAPWDVPPHRYLRFSAAYEPEDIERLAGLGPLAVDGPADSRRRS